MSSGVNHKIDESSTLMERNLRLKEWITI